MTSVATTVANVAVAACTWSAVIEVTVTASAAMASELAVVIDTAIVVQATIVIQTSVPVNSTIYVWCTAVSLGNTC